MNITNQKIMKSARHYLALGNNGAYARLVSGAWRMSTAKDQAEIEAEIAADKMEGEFSRLPHNNCLVAKGE